MKNIDKYRVKDFQIEKKTACFYKRCVKFRWVSFLPLEYVHVSQGSLCLGINTISGKRGLYFSSSSSLACILAALYMHAPSFLRAAPWDAVRYTAISVGSTTYIFSYYGFNSKCEYLFEVLSWLDDCIWKREYEWECIIDMAKHDRYKIDCNSLSKNIV